MARKLAIRDASLESLDRFPAILSSVDDGSPTELSVLTEILRDHLEVVIIIWEDHGTLYWNARPAKEMLIPGGVSRSVCAFVK